MNTPTINTNQANQANPTALVLDSVPSTNLIRPPTGLTLTLNSVYPFKTDLSSLKLKGTFEFSQAVRASDSESVGVRVVFNSPDWLEAPEDLKSQSPTQALIYSHGAELLLKDYLRKVIKDKDLKGSPEGKDNLNVPTLEDLNTFLTSTNSKLITKASLEHLFDSVLAELVVINLASKGIDDETIVVKTLEAYRAFITKLASPAQKYPEGVNLKLVELLEAGEDLEGAEDFAQLIKALITRLTKGTKELESLAEFL